MWTGPRSVIARGLVAGLIGGIAGSAAKLAGEKIYPPRIEGQKPPPAILASKIAGRPLSPGEELAATQAFHWLLGGGMGAAYGAAAESFPIVTLGSGVGFGVALLLGTHESVLPLLGLDKPPWKQPLREHLSELCTHGLYGLVTELVRRALVRRWRGARVATT